MPFTIELFFPKIAFYTRINNILEEMNMKLIRNVSVALLLLLSLSVLCLPALAAPGEPAPAAVSQDGGIGLKAIGSGIAIGIAAAGGAIAMGMTVSKTNESIARQPEAEGKLRSSMMLGLVFIETAIIYALLAVILIIFVL